MTKKGVNQFLLGNIRCRSVILYFLMLNSFLPNSLLASTIDDYQNAESTLTGFVNYEGFHDKSDGHIRLKNGARLGKSESGRPYLRLEKNAYIELNPPDNFSTEKGAISIWIKPFWGESDKESHTIVSMLWKGGSYMALSQGWWEPEGKNRLYFILSNQDYIHCSSEYSLQPNIWSMITVTWSVGDNGFCELYINDERIAQSNTKTIVRRLPEGNILIGSDNGSTLPAGRRAEFDLFGIKLVNRPLLHKEILTRYSDAVTLQPYLSLDRWKHLEPVNKTTGNDQRYDKQESRVIFDEGAGWALSRANTDKIIERISSAGFNVYVPCVWHGRGTYYPTNVAHIDRRVLKRIASGDDPLGYLVQKAHAVGIEVHPWFTVVKREDDIYPQFYDEGTPAGAYNVHNPGYRKFIVDLMLEVAKRYAIDGINLDYIRAMGLCISEYCVKDYEKKYDSNLKLDSYAKVVSRTARERIQKWQDGAVNNIVERLANNIRVIKPEIILSVDAHPVVHDSDRNLEGLDTIGMANSGIVDVIYNMDYRKIINIENISNVRNALKQPDKLITLFGNYERIGDDVVSRDPMLIDKYVGLVRSRWPNTGIAFYLYSKLDDKQVNVLAHGRFKVKVKPKWREDALSDGK